MNMRGSDYVVMAIIFFTSLLAVLAAADSETLGIPRQVLAWAAILNVPLGVLLNQLKRLGGGSDVTVISERRAPATTTTVTTEEVTHGSAPLK